MSMKPLNILPVCAFGLLVGCATPVTPEAAKVRQIAADARNGCRYISTVQVDGEIVYSSRTEAIRDMLNRLRNEVAKAGGNAYTSTSVVVERGFSLPFAQGDAYSCPP